MTEQTIRGYNTGTRVRPNADARAVGFFLPSAEASGSLQLAPIGGCRPILRATNRGKRAITAIRIFQPALHRRVVALCRCLAALAVLGLVFLAARPVVPAFMTQQREVLLSSAERHGVPAHVLAAVVYNEMLGQERRFLSQVIPGDDAVARAVRESLLGWHFLTLKQAQWSVKGVLALFGANTTVGPTGIRVSVGREIQAESGVVSVRYRAHGLMERPSLVLDLASPASAIEYLAANLERGVRRAGSEQAGDWTVCARWHNTGLTADRPDVPRRVWDKGTRYVDRVEGFMPEMTAMISEWLSPPVWRVMLPGDRTPAMPSQAGWLVAYVRPAHVTVRPQ